VSASVKIKLPSASTALFLAVVAFFSFAEAQQTEKIPRIGVLAGSETGRKEAFQQGLREAGYIEGKNIVIEWRDPRGQPQRQREIVAELLRLNVDLIVSNGSQATRAAKEATKSIPIVMAQDPDPVANGFVATLARPGGNITGLSNLNRELNGKRLELLKEVLPRLSRVAVFGSSTFPGNAENLKETERAAKSLGVEVHYLDIPTPADVKTAFQAANKARVDAGLGLGGPVFNSQRVPIVELAAKSRLVVMYPNREAVEAGGLMSYSANINDLFRRAAFYVDRILKGAKPADLPVEQPTKFELVINLKTAKEIGLTIPPNVLARADRVIK
jgi:putative ABC transport system substrate-binding protein